MKKLGLSIGILTAFACVLLWQKQLSSEVSIQPEKETEEQIPTLPNYLKRAEYWKNSLQDPSTQSVPKGIVNRTLLFAKNQLSKKSNLAESLANWKSAGPNHVGGRTRAFAVDVRDESILLTAGVNGGIWKSTDQGETWSIKSSAGQHINVSYLLQDSRLHHQDTWYLSSSGEYVYSSISTYSTNYSGSGLYKSTDNGETWNLIQSADDPTAIDTPYDFITKIAINQQTGSLFISTNLYGILKSTDEGASFSSVLGNASDKHAWSHITATPDGKLVATLSSAAGYNPEIVEDLASKGVYYSTNDGLNWTNISPAQYPTLARRSIVAIPDSDTKIAYIFVDDPDNSTMLFKLDLNANTSVNLTENLGDPAPGVFSGYSMVLSVKPDDSDLVILGGASIYRSTNGFREKIDATKHHLGGYRWPYAYDPPNSNTSNMYAGDHPDYHSIYFDPHNSERIWGTHDGGVSKAENISTARIDHGSGARSPWKKMNWNYQVTQFNSISISKTVGNDQVVGGTQDNGTPYFRHNNLAQLPVNVGGGDDGASYFGKEHTYISGGQIGIKHYPIDENKNIDPFTYPTDAVPIGNNFTTLFAADPTKENLLYVPYSEDFSYKVNRIDMNKYTDDLEYEALIEEMGTILDFPELFKAQSISVSLTHPSHTLYFGGRANGGEHKIYKLKNADTQTTGVEDISVPNTPNWVNVAEVAVNPINANEIIVVLSNYNIIGLYHSLDGGETYNEIEGNLEGSSQLPGPSLRGAVIAPISDTKTAYFIGTSVGLFSTTNLDGMNTDWNPSSIGEVGTAFIEDMDYRPEDGTVAIGTHGRGAFIGKIIDEISMDVLIKLDPSLSSTVEIENNAVQSFENYPNPFVNQTTFSIELRENATISLAIYDLSGKLIKNMFSTRKTSIGINSFILSNLQVSSGNYLAKITGTTSSGIPILLNRKITIVK